MGKVKKVLTFDKKVLLLSGMKYIIIVSIVLLLSCSKENARIGIPSVKITSGPEQGSTVNNENVTIIWKGNENAVDFNFSMDGVWYGWSEDTNYTFILDEGIHTFNLLSRNRLGELQEDTVSLNFSVDAIREPAFWIKSRYISSFRDSLFSLTLMGENISGFSIGYFVIKWNPVHILLQKHYPDSTLTNKSNYIYDSDCGIDSLIIYIGIANDSLYGDFPLFHMDFLSGQIGMDTVKLDKIDVRDIRNHALTIKADITGGIVNVE